MTETDSAEDRPSLDTVIRGFTDAELALREISGAVERFRTASAQLSEAREDQAAVRQALEETTSAAKLIADRVETLNGAVAKTIEVLQVLDPERLWRQLGSIESEARAVATSNDGRLDTLGRTARRAAKISILGVLVGLVVLAMLVGIVAGVLRVS